LSLCRDIVDKKFDPTDLKGDDLKSLFSVLFSQWSLIDSLTVAQIDYIYKNCGKEISDMINQRLGYSGFSSNVDFYSLLKRKRDDDY